MCNVCASKLAEQAESQSDKTVVWDLPPDLLERLFAEADEQGVKPETTIIEWIEKRAGRPLDTIRLYNRLDGTVYKLR